MAKPWDGSGGDLAIKMSSTCSEDDFFPTSVTLLVNGVCALILSSIALASLIDK